MVQPRWKKIFKVSSIAVVRAANHNKQSTLMWPDVCACVFKASSLAMVDRGSDPTLLQQSWDQQGLHSSPTSREGLEARISLTSRERFSTENERANSLSYGEPRNI